MSYINQPQDPRRSAAALVGVVAIHAAIGIGLVVGLSYTGVITKPDGWNPFTLTPDALPKPPPPEPAKSQPAQTSVVVIPPTPLPPLPSSENTLTSDPGVNTGTALAAVDDPVVGPMPEPLKANLFTPRKPRPSNNPARWITNDDYPARALRAEAEGVAGYRLIVSSSGQVSACEVTRSTGNGSLDDATCDFLLRRARFEPATDETGTKVVGSYTGTVKWEIPE